MPVNSTDTISYTGVAELWANYDELLLKLAAEAQSVAELGGGANPILAAEQWRSVPNRVVIDISAHELALGAGDFDKRVAIYASPSATNWSATTSCSPRCFASTCLVCAHSMRTACDC